MTGLCLSGIIESGRSIFTFPGGADRNDFGKELANIEYDGVFILEVTPLQNIQAKL